MNFVFLSPHFPPNFYHFCVELKKAGATVLAIGDAPYSELSLELRDSITEYCAINMSSYDTVYKTINYFVGKYGKIDRIDSQNEYWLGLEARIRQDFNIFGQQLEDLAINQSKLRMKEVFKKVKVPCVEGISTSTSSEILNNFIKKHGYPFIIKPDKGVGASNTHRIDNEEQMAMVLKELGPEYIIEPFVFGTLVTFDGIADKTGKIMFCASFEMSDDVLTALKEQKDSYYYYGREIDPQLEKYGRKMVKGFNIKERFFHCEFFRTLSGKYQAIEINVRPPGGYDLDMQNYSCDIDLYKVWAELVVNNRNVLKFERKYNVATVLRRDRFKYLYSPLEVMQKLGNIAVEYKRLPDIFAAAMGNDTFILRHPEMPLLLDAISLAMKKV